NPVAGVGDPNETEVGDPSLVSLGQMEAEVTVPFSPNHHRGDIDRSKLLLDPHTVPNRRAIIIDGSRERSRLSEGQFVTFDVRVAERPRVHRVAAQRAPQTRKSSGAEGRFREPGK